MTGIALRYLGYFGPEQSPADLRFELGLNVICGASETGKSFIVESIDFMLGQENPVREISERSGYDRVRLLIESGGYPPLTLDRSVEGGHFRAYEEALYRDEPKTDPKVLRQRHSAARQDTLSHELLARSGFESKTLRRNTSGATRSLSFRDLVRLCVVTEQEIQRRTSPLLSGQYIFATPEYAAFKLLLTGMDDSALVSTREVTIQRGQESGKVDLLNQLIDDVQAELDEGGADEVEASDQLARIEVSVEEQNKALTNIQRAFDQVFQRRAQAAMAIQDRKARMVEIDELTGRFDLLDRHYETDLRRLEAIHETGSLFIHLEQKPCPLCGALPADQHLDSECEGNNEAVVQAADAEMEKIRRLRRELRETVQSLQREREDLSAEMAAVVDEYRNAETELAEIAPPVREERASYNQLISKRADIRATLEKMERLNRLKAQRDELLVAEGEDGSDKPATRTQVSKSVLNEFSQTIERILHEWHFPNPERVFFDESKRDFQIGGKERGSTGKGLRAITHAAVTIGLMEFCREHELPHPGFVVLDSPLLAYWKPEGDEDDLRGTDLKEKFYRYLLGMKKENQIIIVENEHPPDFVSQRASVTIFTKNPHKGRYGFF